MLVARNRHRSDRGFTTVEIAIVLVILCIIAIAVTFTVRGSNESSPQSACNVLGRTPVTAPEVSLAPASTRWHRAPDSTFCV